MIEWPNFDVDDNLVNLIISPDQPHGDQICEVASSPALRLPAETLSLIIRHTLPPPLEPLWRGLGISLHSGDAHLYCSRVLIATHICATWRQIILGDSAIWARVHCEIPESLFNLFVKQAQPHPLTLCAIQPQNGPDRPPDLPVHSRILNNLIHVLNNRFSVRELRTSFCLEDYLSEFGEMIILDADSPSFQDLQVLYVSSLRSSWKPWVDVEEGLFAHGLPSTLKKINLGGCSVPWLSLAKLHHLTWLELTVADEEPAYMTEYSEWTTVLRQLSSTLVHLGVYHDASFHPANSCPLYHFSGERVHMKALRTLNLGFEYCASFANQLSFGSPISATLSDWGSDWKSGLGFLNDQFASLSKNQSSELVNGCTFGYEYAHGKDSVTLIIGNSVVEYENVYMDSLLADEFAAGLSQDIRTAITSLFVLGYPEGCDFPETNTHNFKSLSILFPEVESLTIHSSGDKEPQVMLEGLLREWAESQSRTESPFPKCDTVSVMNADFTGKTRGVEELLVKALDQRLGQSLMITTLHLTASQLSHTCADAIENLEIPWLKILMRPTSRSAWTHHYDYEGPDADTSDEEDTDTSNEAGESDDATSD